MEAVRYGCKVLHGPNISNFKEIYEFLKKKKLSTKIYNQSQMTTVVKKTLIKKTYSKKIIQNMHTIGKKILNKTYNEVNL